MSLKVFEVKGLLETLQVDQEKAKGVSIRVISVTDLIREPLEKAKLPVPEEILFPRVSVVWIPELGAQEIDIALYMCLGRAEETKSHQVLLEKLSIHSPTVTMKLSGIHLKSTVLNYYLSAVELKPAEKINNVIRYVPYLISGYVDSMVSNPSNIIY